MEYCSNLVQTTYVFSSLSAEARSVRFRLEAMEGLTTNDFFYSFHPLQVVTKREVVHITNDWVLPVPRCFRPLTNQEPTGPLTLRMWRRPRTSWTGSRWSRTWPAQSARSNSCPPQSHSTLNASTARGSINAVTMNRDPNPSTKKTVGREN